MTYLKTPLLSGVALLLLSSAPLSSQAPPPKSSLEALTALKAAGQDLLNKQEKTLGTLDALHKTAEQIRIFAKRT